MEKEPRLQKIGEIMKRGLTDQKLLNSSGIILTASTTGAGASELKVGDETFAVGFFVLAAGIAWSMVNNIYLHGQLIVQEENKSGDENESI